MIFLCEVRFCAYVNTKTNYRIRLNAEIYIRLQILLNVPVSENCGKLCDHIFHIKRVFVIVRQTNNVKCIIKKILALLNFIEYLLSCLAKF